jgi:hypothetical protein
VDQEANRLAVALLHEVRSGRRGSLSVLDQPCCRQATNGKLYRRALPPRGTARHYCMSWDWGIRRAALS